jgi:hypothetical protein
MMFARHGLAKLVGTALAAVAALGLTTPGNASADATEDAFLRTVSADGVVFANPEELIQRAQVVCAAFSAGLSPARVHTEMLANDSAMSPRLTTIFMARAVQFYCPKYADLLFS